jgi:thiamine biosynthesis lipoprotein
LNFKYEEIRNLYHFSKEAMATVFEIWLCDVQEKYASQAGVEAFNILCSMEQDLSRYIENSEVSQIASLKKDQSLVLSPHVMECLQISKGLYHATKGAFDITMDKEKPSFPGLSNFEHLFIDEDNFTVTAGRDNIQIDFGGIAKGLALDKIAEVFCEWEIESFLIHGGYSSVLAGKPPENTGSWPISLSNPFANNQKFAEIPLGKFSISGSGLEKGCHIIDPSSHNKISGQKAAWAMGPTAALTDALSTTFMIFSEEQIKNYCQENSHVTAILTQCQNGQFQVDVFGQHKVEILQG